MSAYLATLANLFLPTFRRTQFCPLPAFAPESTALLPTGTAFTGLAGAFFMVQPTDFVVNMGGVPPFKSALTANSTCLFVLGPGASGLLSMAPM